MSSFSGQEVQVLTAGDVRYSTSIFPPGFVTAPHAHETAYFCLVVDGVSAQRSGGKQRLRDRGRAYYYPPGESQEERFGKGGSRLFSVQMSTAVLAHLPGADRLPERSLELAGPAALLVRRLFGSCPHDPLDVEDLTMMLVAAMTRERCEGARWAPAVRDYLHAHFRDKPTLLLVLTGPATARRLATARCSSRTRRCRPRPRRGSASSAMPAMP